MKTRTFTTKLGRLSLSLTLSSRVSILLPSGERTPEGYGFAGHVAWERVGAFVAAGNRFGFWAARIVARRA